MPLSEMVSIKLVLLQPSLLGRVRELLISSKKAGTIPVFAENEKGFFCLRFSITHPHDQNLKELVCKMNYQVVSKPRFLVINLPELSCEASVQVSCEF
jgi:hypothetical protein